MSEIVGRHLSYQDAKDSASRLTEFWNEPHRILREGDVFLIERGWPKVDRIALHTCFPKELSSGHA